MDEGQPDLEISLPVVGCCSVLRWAAGKIPRATDGLCRPRNQLYIGHRTVPYSFQLSVVLAITRGRRSLLPVLPFGIFAVPIALPNVGQAGAI